MALVPDSKRLRPSGTRRSSGSSFEYRPRTASRRLRTASGAAATVAAISAPPSLACGAAGTGPSRRRVTLAYWHRPPADSCSDSKLKSKLKDLVLADDSRVLEALDYYEATGNRASLQGACVRPEAGRWRTALREPYALSAPLSPVQPSSPAGTWSSATPRSTPGRRR